MDDIDARTAAREAALREELDDQRRLALVSDYIYDKAQEAFWDLRDGTKHSKVAVDASIPLEQWRVEIREEPEGAAGRGRPRARERLIPPSTDIMRVENDQFVEGATWWPGQPQIVKDWFIDSDGFFPAKGRRMYNRYRPIPELAGNALKAQPWIDHVKALWPDPIEHEYFFDYWAHALQRPGEKCNAAIVLSGQQGIGKDVALSAVKHAMGDWNCKDINPDQLFGQYKPFLQTLALIVNESKPQEDEFRASNMYNIMKPLIAAPPNTLPVDEKYQNLKYVINVLRVVITTNHPLDLFIPEDDRRMFIMHSRTLKGWQPPEYFAQLGPWCEGEGGAHVQAFLLSRDIRAFNPKAAPPKTQGWEDIANTWITPDDALTQALDALGRPDVLLATELLQVQFDGADEIQGMLKSPRKIAHRLSKEGYVTIRPDASDKENRWAFSGPNRTIRSRLALAKQELMGDPVRVRHAIRERGKWLASTPLGESLKVVK
jgi:hypothetical protein